MKSSSAAPLAAAAAAAVLSCSMGPKLFVQTPSTQSSSSALRNAGAAQQQLSQVAVSSNSAMTPRVGISAAAGLAVLAAQQRVQGRKMKTSSVVMQAFDASTQLGVQAPLGFWDPAGYMQEGTEADFLRYRSIELKHGRIAMLAAMGYITPEIVKFPGFLSPNSGLKFADIPNGLAAISKVPAAGWGQILAYMAFCEVNPGAGSDVERGAPGDFGWLTQYYSDTRRNAELANGRLAMMAIVGMIAQDGLTGSAWGDWALYTASPLR